MELLECQRTVVEGCWQTETIFHEVRFPGTVATIHGTYLGDGDVALVDNHQIVVGEEVEQAVRAFASLSAVEVTAVVLDARAMAQLLNHLHIILHTFLYPLGLDGVTGFLEESYLFYQVVLYLPDGDIGLFLCGHEEVGRIELILLESCQTIERYCVDLFQRVYLVIPESHTEHHLAISHSDVYCVALHTEAASLEVDIVSYI